MADFQHWFGNGHAPNFSRCVAQASTAVDAAQEALRTALELGYPRDAEVYVIHSRGCFHGTVEGWDIYGCRVMVKNSATRKVSKWWAAHVELVKAGRADAESIAAALNAAPGVLASVPTLRHNKHLCADCTTENACQNRLDLPRPCWGTPGVQEVPASPAPGVRGLVMADGSPLLDYLNVGDDPPETDEWTKGYHEARRRLYRILAPQLAASGVLASDEPQRKELFSWEYELDGHWLTTYREHPHDYNPEVYGHRNLRCWSAVEDAAGVPASDPPPELDTAQSIGMQIEGWVCYGMPAQALTPEQRSEIREFAESFEECSQSHDELVDMADHDLIRTAYWAMVEYARGQM